MCIRDRICTIVNYLFNDGKLDISEYAQIGKYAENNFWNKQSGLLDQMACAAGGIVTIDFKDQANPVLEKLAFDFDEDVYKRQTKGGVFICKGANFSEEYLESALKKGCSAYISEVGYQTKEKSCLLYTSRCV